MLRIRITYYILRTEGRRRCRECRKRSYRVKIQPCPHFYRIRFFAGRIRYLKTHFSHKKCLENESLNIASKLKGDVGAENAESCLTQYLSQPVPTRIGFALLLGLYVIWKLTFLIRIA